MILFPTREAFQPVACPDQFPRSEESYSLVLVSCGLILAAPAQAKCHWWVLHRAGAPQGKGSALEHGDKCWGVNAGFTFPAWLQEQAQPSMPQGNLWFGERQLPPRPQTLEKACLTSCLQRRHSDISERRQQKVMKCSLHGHWCVMPFGVPWCCMSNHEPFASPLGRGNSTYKL